MKVAFNKVLFFFLLFFLNVSLMTASKMYEGFLVTNQKDTIHGQVNLDCPISNQLKVRIVDQANKKREFKAEELKSYAFTFEKFNPENKKYELEKVVYERKVMHKPPVFKGPTNVLVKLKVDGPIKLYHYFLESCTITENPFIYQPVLETPNAGLVVLTRQNYIEELKKAIRDYDVLYKKIGSRGYKFKEIHTTLIAYNEWTNR
mgnify:CR=1 FL=1